MGKKKILILYAPLGAGHGKAAKAIEEAFLQNYPDFIIKNADVLDFAFGLFGAGIPAAFDYITSYAPFLYKWIYKSFNHQKRYHYLNHGSGVFIKKPNLIEFIKDFNPDFILSTNPLPMQAVSLTKHQKIIDILSANVCTDYGFHSLWYNRDVNYYFVANEDVKESLISHGVSSEKIITSGIPISSKFNRLADRQKILARLGFKENTPTLLIVGGKIKHRSLFEIVQKIGKTFPVQFIIVAGRDKALKKELEKSELNKNPRVRIFGFVNNIEDYMSVADLVLTKAGGLTVAECMQKNLPMVINDFIPGQEEDNVKYLVEKGAGLEAKNIKEATKIITDLFLNPEKILEMKENCKKAARPNAAKEIVDFVALKLN